MFYLKVYGPRTIGRPTDEARIGTSFPTIGEAVEEVHAAALNDGFAFGKPTSYRIFDTHGDIVQEAAL